VIVLLSAFQTAGSSARSSFVLVSQHSDRVAHPREENKPGCRFISLFRPIRSFLFVFSILLFCLETRKRTMVNGGDKDNNSTDYYLSLCLLGAPGLKVVEPVRGKRVSRQE
jgi:hypothetical protein